MNRVGDELLSEAEHLQRMALDALERRDGAVDEEPLGRSPDAQRRGVAEPLSRQPLDAVRDLDIAHDIDVNRGDSAAGDSNAGLGPTPPLRKLELGGGARGVPRPIRIIAPAATTMAARLLGAGLDRNDRI